MTDETAGTVDEPTYDVRLRIELADNRIELMPYSSYRIDNGGALSILGPNGPVYYSGWYWKAVKEVLAEVDSQAGAVAD